MPFIAQERRDIIDRGGWLADWTPGDRCYAYYKGMVRLWKENPRWTTAHEIYKKMRSSTQVTYVGRSADFENKCAEELAWQVFFQLKVMPYELEKMEQSGDI